MRVAVLLALALGVVAAVPSSAAASEPTGRLLVSLEPGPIPTAVAAAHTGVRVPEIGLVTVRPNRGESLKALAHRLRSDSRVRAVQPEMRHTPRAQPNDPALTDPETAVGTPPGTPVQWWPQRLGLFEAWDVTRGGDALVAVLDSGIEGGHPDFAGKVRDTLDVDPTPGAGGPLTDEAGHGSHVASLACGAMDNGVGMVGAGGDCGLLIAKTDFSDGAVAQAIVDAADRGAEAITMSFGTDGGREPPRALVEAIEYAAERDAVLVAAAADQDTEEQGDPANILQPTGTGPDLDSNLGLSITAATFSDQRASFAGRGSQISMAAYGAFERGQGPRGLLGAFPAAQTSFERGDIGPPPAPPCRCRTTFRGDDRFAYLQGTSMATAIVAGVAALVRDLNPDLRGSEVVRLLKETARRAPGTGWEPELGWGIVDARAAVQRARELDRRAPTSRLRAPKRTRRRTITLRWRGKDDHPPHVIASGIERYEIWRSVDGLPAVRIDVTRGTAKRLRVRRGRRYSFYTVAVDGAGNREAPPRRADARTRVLFSA